MSRQNLRLLVVLIVLIVAVKIYERGGGSRSTPRESSRETRATRQLDEELKPATAVEAKEGLAAAIAIDVSGSMDEKIAGQDGRRERKIEIARRAALDLVDQFASYARDHADEPVRLAIYEFSRRRGEDDCRVVVPMGTPDREKAAAAIARLSADGGTPIGRAMITAKRALDDTGLTRRHLLVVTDGENTDGIEPDRVAVGIGKRPDAERPAIYFIAFDVEANRFSGVRDAGGVVLSAANAAELNTTLDSLLRGKILVEK
ncbi:MAG TPA: vWA domain-containing protein [Vicinamibacterales bacterium]